jgi:hypothetical protein
MNRSTNTPDDAGPSFGTSPGGPEMPQLLDKLAQAARLLGDVSRALGLSRHGPTLGPTGEPDLSPVVPFEPLPDLDLNRIIDALNAIKIGRGPGIRIGGVEMTQSTQFFNYNQLGTGVGADNAVPLITNKELVLRVYVEIRPNAGYVPVEVTGRVRFAGQEFTPLNGPLRPQKAGLVQRSRLNDTLNFRIPAALCRGSRTFQVRVFDAATLPFGGVGIYVDGSVIDFASTTDTFVATFRDVPPMRLMGVMVNYVGSNVNLPAPIGTDLVDTVSRFLPMFPLHGFDFGPCVSTPWGDDMTLVSGTKGSGWDSLFSYIANLRDASDVSAYYVGLLPKNLSSTIGTGQLGLGNPGIAIAASGNTRALSHELGHATLLGHVNAGGAPAPFDANYPKYRDGTLQFGTIGEAGLNTTRMTLFNPVTATDLMTYFDSPDVLFPASTWISPYNYQLLMYQLLATNGTGVLQAAISVNATAMILNFRVHREGRVELQPSYVVPDVPVRRVQERTRPLMIDLIGSDDDVLATHRCHEHNTYQDPDGPFLDYHEIISWPEGVARLAFVRDGRVVHSLDVAERAPHVELGDLARVQRQGDLARLTWTHDGPGDPLPALIRYSHDDGSTWQAVAAGVTASHLVNLDLLPGGDRCRLQVLVSSGLRTTVATTEPFVVPRKPRVAHLVSPREGEVFRVDEPIAFLGGGYSPDGGTCDLHEVSWHSNLDGLLGTGYHVVRDDLRAGTHRITLNLPDGQRGEANASTWIRIVDRDEDGAARCNS